MNILIIEDNTFLAEKIKATFEKNIISNRIKTLYSYSDFLHELGIINSYDIILVDILLSNINEKNGIDIVKIIRNKKIKIPIVIISNISEISYIKNSFNIGANDYLVKPIRLKELEIRTMKRFKIHLSTTRFYNNETIEYKELKYRFQDNEFYFENLKINLSKKSKYILSIFISKPEILISENELIEKIWGDIEFSTNRNIRIVILRLKQSLKSSNIDSWIQNIRGEGYILKR